MWNDCTTKRGRKATKSYRRLFSISCQINKAEIWVPLMFRNLRIQIKQTRAHIKEWLVGGLNPSEKYESNWESSLNRDDNNKYSKPPPRWSNVTRVPAALWAWVSRGFLWNLCTVRSRMLSSNSLITPLLLRVKLWSSILPKHPKKLIPWRFIKKGTVEKTGVTMVTMIIFRKFLQGILGTPPNMSLPKLK